MEEQKKKILEHFKNCTHAVVATFDANTGFPEAAFVGLSETEDLQVIFGTRRITRKYKNLLQNPNVAFVVGGDKGVTVQYEGVCREALEEERVMAASVHATKIPSAAKFSSGEDQTYFIVTPKWIRFTDYSKGAPEIFEISL